MSWTAPAPEVNTTVLTAMPDSLRRHGVVSEWSTANKAGAPVDCFIEGPCFDPKGNLYIVDIPHGRIFRITTDKKWQVVAEYDGEPNGLAWHADHKLIIADYKRGILALDPDSVSDGARPATPTPIVTRHNSQSFKGVNDLIVSRNGDIYFTDQGQTGLHDPTGRVYRYTSDGHLQCLLSNGPSPNGLVLDADEKVLFVAMTRDNAVWRLPLLADGSTSKVGRFASFHGTSGPDGLTIDRKGNLYVAHASLGAVFVVNGQGEPVARIVSCAGKTITNVCFGPQADQPLIITDSSTGSILLASSATLA